MCTNVRIIRACNFALQHGQMTSGFLHAAYATLHSGIRFPTLDQKFPPFNEVLVPKKAAGGGRAACSGDTLYEQQRCNNLQRAEGHIQVPGSAMTDHDLRTEGTDPAYQVDSHVANIGCRLILTTPTVMPNPV